jgi:hypothetical protein
LILQVTAAQVGAGVGLVHPVTAPIGREEREEGIGKIGQGREERGGGKREEEISVAWTANGGLLFVHLFGNKQTEVIHLQKTE